MRRLAIILSVTLVATANVIPLNEEQYPFLTGDSPDDRIWRTTRQIPEGIKNAAATLSSVENSAAELSSQIYNMYLSVGQSVAQGIRNTQAAILSLVPPVIVPVPVIVRGARSVDAVDSTPLSDIPAMRTGKQFGLGFSGSGAQASSQSFGGGGGFGGFPGGGFGGGISGSQASAGAGSFGGGGGGFFG